MFGVAPLFESNIAKSITYTAKSNDFTPLNPEKNCFTGKQFFPESMIEKIVFPGCQVLIAKRAKHFFYTGGGDDRKNVFLGCQVLIAKSIEQILKNDFSIGFWILIDNKKILFPNTL